jgi:hypothetical protein
MAALVPIGKAELEPLTNWAQRTRAHFEILGKLLKNNFKIRPLICEIVGMPGTGKTALCNELASKYFKSYHVCATSEPQIQIRDVTKENQWEYRKAQFDLVVENLKKAWGGKADIEIFDRGIFDFLIWFNVDLINKVIDEAKVWEYFQAIFANASKVDVLIVMIGDAAQCSEKFSLSKSIPFMDSFGLHERSEEQTEWRYALYRALYSKFFVETDAETEKVRSAVKCLLTIDVEKFSRDFTQIFQEVAIVLNLHLVFKAWESIFLTYFEDEPYLEDEKIAAIVGLLIYPLTFLRKILESRFDAAIKEKIEAYLKKEIVIGRCGKDGRDLMVISDALRHPLKYNIIRH